MSVVSGTRPVRPAYLRDTGRVFVWVLFILTALVRIWFALYAKVGTTYKDELLYPELAQSLWNGTGLTVWGTPLRFSKILYSLLLAPFYAVGDPALRLYAISAFNAVLISSALFPGLFLARRIACRPWQIYVALLLLALDPNGCFSMSLMAENLFFPLALWVLLAGLRVIEQKRPFSALAFGFLSLCLYLTKETGIALSGAILTAWLISLREPEARRLTLQKLLLAVVGFAVPYLALRLTLFGGMAYAYSDQVSLSFLKDSSSLVYLLYAFVCLLLYFAVSGWILPVTVSLTDVADRSGEERTLLRILVPWALFTALGVAFGVTLPEEFPDYRIRIHLRYMLPMMYPFLLLFLVSVDPEGKPGRSRIFLSLGAAVLSGLLLTLPVFGSLVDAPALELLRGFSENVPSAELIFRFIPAVAILLSLILWARFRGKGMLCFFLPLLAVAAIATNASYIAFTRANTSLSEDQLAQARLLEECLEPLSGNILFVRDREDSLSSRIADTYTDEMYYVADAESLHSVVKQSPSAVTVPLSEAGLTDPLSFVSAGYTSPAEIQWIVSADPTLLLSPRYAEEITPDGLTMYRVWRNTEPDLLPLPDPSAYTLGEEITFHGWDANFIAHVTTGFSGCEIDYTWSLGEESTVTLSPVGYRGGDLTLDWVWFTTLGNQRYEIYINDVYLDSGDAFGPGETTITVPEDLLEDGQVTISFYYPDASTPGNGDERLLAFAFESVTLSNPE